MALTCIKMVSALMCAAALARAPLACGGQAPGDADLLAARDAARMGQWKLLEQLQPRFAGQLLAAYPAYWLLAGNLDRADAADVQAFLARYPDGPLAESLRRAWLKVLGKSGSWELFRAEHPLLVSDDVEITCYSFQERLARADSGALDEARTLYLAGGEAPAACDPVFAALVEAKRVSDDETWERIRKLLAAGYLKDAKRTNAFLSPRQRLSEQALERAGARPAEYLAHENSRALGRGEREIVMFATERLARSQPDEAAERLESFTARLGADAGYAWSQLAYQAALNLHPRALEWYARAAGTPLTDGQIAWKARAALRAGDWKEVLAAIESLSPMTAREPTWRYWRARALRALGETDAADALLRGLAGQMNFYGLLASEDLGLAVAPDWNGFHPAAQDIERVRANAGIRRALELYRLDMPNEGLQEWIWAIRGFDDRELLAAAELARQADVPDRAINTAGRTVQLHDYSRRYPMPHREALAAAAKQWDIDEAMLYGLIRQESRFVAEARSPVGAVGLMQLMPATARWIARQIPVPRFRSAMLVRPEVNLAMGTYYFRRVLSALGDPILATTAYNAGPGRARRWRDDKPLEGAIYAETIPYGETREYVKQVFTNAWFYRRRLGGQVASLRQLLGIVPGRAGDTSVAAYIP